MNNYKKYKIGELFDSSNGNFDIQKKHINGKGEYVITAGLTNNGILGKTDVEARIFDEQTITIDMFGFAFYRPFKYKMVTHARVFSLKPKFKINDKQGLYITSLFKHFNKIYGYNNMCSWEKIKDEFIYLPINNNEIDFKFMENYISELEKERISELATYLKVSGLDNYNLSSQDCEILNKSVNTKKYRLDELFEIKSPSKRFNANAVKLLNEKEDGAYRYIVRTSQNNGQRGYIKADSKYLSPKNSIAFGQDTATVFYQNEPYFTGDKIKIMTLKNHELNEKIALYFLTIIRKAFTTFSWGQNSFNEKVLKSMIVNLPIDENCKIDYKYIEDYITVQQKIAIKDVVKWKDDIISATKKVING